VSGVSGVAATEEGEAVTDALTRLYDDVCRDFYRVLADDSMETRQTFFDQLAANIREVKAAHAEALAAALSRPVSRHSLSERARRDVLYGLRDYEPGDGEVVPEGPRVVIADECLNGCGPIDYGEYCPRCEMDGYR
jgi:hypothetical protein